MALLRSGDREKSSAGKQIRLLRESGETVTLDGGLATELESLGCDLSDSLWSARVLIDQPERVLRVHRAFLEAGAQILTSSSYQLSFDGVLAQGGTRDEVRSWLERSSRLALEARGSMKATEVRWVAASVGPYGAFLADGSEYRGDYGVDDDRLASFHRERLLVLASSGVDLLACETIPSEQEARVLLELLEPLSVDAWLSFTLRDPEHLADGSQLDGLVTRLRDSCPAGFERIAAVGFNCVFPTVVDQALPLLGEQTELPLVIYPNSGEHYDGVARRFVPLPTLGVETWPIDRWWLAGARLFGGCCRVGSSQISLLAERLRALETDSAR